MHLSPHFTNPPWETAFVHDISVVVSGSVTRPLIMVSKLVLTLCSCFFANLAATTLPMAADGCQAPCISALEDLPGVQALASLAPSVEPLADLEPGVQHLGPHVEALADLEPSVEALADVAAMADLEPVQALADLEPVEALADLGPRGEAELEPGVEALADLAPGVEADLEPGVGHDGARRCFHVLVPTAAA